MSTPTKLVYCENDHNDGSMIIPAMKPLRYMYGGKNEHYVFGACYSDAEFEQLFKPYDVKVLNDWKTLGLIVNGKPISKTAFRRLLDVHTYKGRKGSGVTTSYIGYIMNGRDMIYQFFPEWVNSPKAHNISFMYQNYLDVCNGDVEAFDCRDIIFGNCGIPISYGEVRHKHQSNEPIF
jgi:hypothetical protein